jgi:predicted amino acid racemase
VFLELLKSRNPELLRVSAELALARLIPPNSFVLDVDTIRANGLAIRHEADRLGLRLYFMTKQIGRNPVVTQALVKEGKKETVAVDVQGAYCLAANGIGLGHVGNLVQTPMIDLPHIIRLQPEVVSVFSVAKALQISSECVRQGVEQALLLRVSDPDRDVYLGGMEGGITLSDLPDAASEISSLPGIRIEGVTTFPALSYSDAAEPQATPNFETLLRAKELLAQKGIVINQVNAPGNTSVYTLELQARLGATHVEPGHGFLGTTPLHLIHQDLPERPAACYVTEVAHHVEDRAYVYGGGFFIDDPTWIDPRFERSVLVGTSVDELLNHEASFLGAGSGSSGGFGGIDYYGFLSDAPHRLPVGATVLMGFRIQSFVTRAHIVPITGVATNPRLEGVFDQYGRRLAQHT